MSSVLGIDFGTSNTAAAILDKGGVRILNLEAGQETVPTAVFLDQNSRRTRFGSDAVRAMIDGREGRFMRALKSVLGTPLAREKRQILYSRTMLLEIVTEFLGEIRLRAEAAEGRHFRRVVAGRPVRFHSADVLRDAQAEADLMECYLAAGFEEIRFVLEPEAAARAAGAGRGIGLIIDIGGGTSDFTLFRDRDGAMEVLASHGIRLGGTDFDRTLSLDKVMPLLGLGGELRNEFGPGRHPVPRALFHELASWEKIAFLYSPKILRDVTAMSRRAVDPRRMTRLLHVIENEIGHDLAFAVEAAKIAANGAREAGIDLDSVECGLRPVLTATELASALHPSTQAIQAAIGDVLALAGVAADAVERAIFVGGSSLLKAVETGVRSSLPGARTERSDVFTAVVRGLALCSADVD